VKQIADLTNGASKVDFYSGVGSIGIPIGMTRTLVETDVASVAMARQNAQGLPIEVIEATAETALEYVPSDATLIVDPPRAGLHRRLISQILKTNPTHLIYLSCNPVTQARDLQLLMPIYKVTTFQVYNFFPRTPHIETLAFLTLV
jgi:tRNA/tmRNA/rRNA uracil-C5-methylase (TrmA/RlmC/RlmD family)